MDELNALASVLQAYRRFEGGIAGKLSMLSLTCLRGLTENLRRLSVEAGHMEQVLVRRVELSSPKKDEGPLKN